MTTGTNLYSQGFGTTSSATFPGSAIVSQRAPTSNDYRGSAGQYPIGQVWVDQTDNAAYMLISYASAAAVVTANWIEIT